MTTFTYTKVTREGQIMQATLKKGQTSKDGEFTQIGTVKKGMGIWCAENRTGAYYAATRQVAVNKLIEAIKEN